MGAIAPPIPKIAPKIFRLIKLLMCKPKKYSRIRLFRHTKGIRKKRRIRKTGENSIIEAGILNIVTCLDSAVICSKIQVYDVMVEYNK